MEHFELEINDKGRFAPKEIPKEICPICGEQVMFPKRESIEVEMDDSSDAELRKVEYIKSDPYDFRGINQ